MNDNANLFEGFIGSLTSDDTGNVWIGTSEGYFYNDGNTEDFTYLRPEMAAHPAFGIPPILKSKQGNIWMANWESGVLKMDTETGDFENFKHDPSNPAGIGGPTVMSFFEDSGGNMVRS